MTTFTTNTRALIASCMCDVHTHTLRDSYKRLTDNKWMLLPWDADIMFGEYQVCVWAMLF
jgi:hypothetical protein